MRNMKYDWIRQAQEEVQEEQKPKVVRIRMMSTGNDLACGYEPKYGLYVEQKGDRDPMDLSATAFTSLGGGFIRTADIEFYIRKDPKDPLLGYIVEKVRRQNRHNVESVQIVGYCATMVSGAVKIAYREALREGMELAKNMGCGIEDKVMEDLADSTHVCWK